MNTALRVQPARRLTHSCPSISSCRATTSPSSACPTATPGTSCWITAVSDVARQMQADIGAHLITAIAEYSDDAIIGRTLEGIITSWNPAAERMFGYSCEEIVGKSIDRLIPEDRLDEIKAILARNRDSQHIEHLH